MCRLGAQVLLGPLHLAAIAAKSVLKLMLSTIERYIEVVAKTCVEVLGLLVVSFARGWLHY